MRTRGEVIAGVGAGGGGKSKAKSRLRWQKGVEETRAFRDEDIIEDRSGVTSGSIATSTMHLSTLTAFFSSVPLPFMEVGCTAIMLVKSMRKGSDKSSIIVILVRTSLPPITYHPLYFSLEIQDLVMSLDAYNLLLPPSLTAVQGPLPSSPYHYSMVPVATSANTTTACPLSTGAIAVE